MNAQLLAVDGPPAPGLSNLSIPKRPKPPKKPKPPQRPLEIARCRLDVLNRAIGDIDSSTKTTTKATKGQRRRDAHVQEIEQILSTFKELDSSGSVASQGAPQTSRQNQGVSLAGSSVQTSNTKSNSKSIPISIPRSVPDPTSNHGPSHLTKPPLNSTFPLPSTLNNFGQPSFQIPQAGPPYFGQQWASMSTELQNGLNFGEQSFHQLCNNSVPTLGQYFSSDFHTYGQQGPSQQSWPSFQNPNLQFAPSQSLNMPSTQHQTRSMTQSQSFSGQIDSVSLGQPAQSMVDASRKVLQVQDGKTKAHKSAEAYARHRDPIVPPSAESGGIPEPEPLYLFQSQLPSVIMDAPRPLLLVMDLNGTILYRPDKKRSTYFIERKNTQRFLKNVLDNFCIMIWSSAKSENVRGMVNQLFEDTTREKLLAVWGRDRMGLSAADYHKRVQVYKRLTRVWSNPEIQAKHPDAKQGALWDQSNTILLDDSKEKARSEPHNIVQVPEFTGAGEHPQILTSLVSYLMILRTQSDVSSYIRQHPFKASK